MFRFVVLFCAVFAHVSGNSTQVSQCVSHAGALPSNTHIHGCTTPPCVLPESQDAVIDLEFTTPHTVHSMKTLATAYLGTTLGPLPIPFDIGEQSETCNYLTNASCPVQTGQSLQYTFRLHVEPIFPANTTLTVEFRVVDESNGPLVCLRVPITFA